MLGWFKRLIRSKNDIALQFNTAEGAFTYICKYMECEVRENVTLPCLVLDARNEFGLDTEVGLKPDGIQLAAIKVPSNDGGFLVMAESLSASGPRLSPGQLVAWRAMGYVPEVGNGISKVGGDKRSGWCGFILAVLKPTWKSNNWLIDQKFKQ